MEVPPAELAEWWWARGEGKKMGGGGWGVVVGDQLPPPPIIFFFRRHRTIPRNAPALSGTSCQFGCGATAGRPEACVGRLEVPPTEL